MTGFVLGSSSVRLNRAAQGENARELQRLILTHLELSVPMVTTQVVGRDRYIEWVSWMANVATSVEKLLVGNSQLAT